MHKFKFMGRPQSDWYSVFRNNLLNIRLTIYDFLGTIGHLHGFKACVCEHVGWF